MSAAPQYAPMPGARADPRSFRQDPSSFFADNASMAAPHRFQEDFGKGQHRQAAAQQAPHTPQQSLPVITPELEQALLSPAMRGLKELQAQEKDAQAARIEREVTLALDLTRKHQDEELALIVAEEEEEMENDGILDPLPGIVS
jgi:hypothetical protein